MPKRADPNQTASSDQGIACLLLLILKFLRGFYFSVTSHTRSFVKIKSSRKGEITLPFTNIGKCTVLPNNKDSFENGKAIL